MLFENEEIKTLLKAKSFEENKTIVIEELSELQKEICKDLRGYERREEIKEEMADVYICLQLLKEIYNFSDNELEKMYERKMKRNIERITKTETKEEIIKTFASPEECLKEIIKKRYKSGYILFEQAAKRFLEKYNLNTSNIDETMEKLIDENILEKQFVFSNDNCDFYNAPRFYSRENALKFEEKIAETFPGATLRTIYIVK